MEDEWKLSCTGKDTFTGAFKEVFKPTGTFGGQNVAMAAKAALMSVEPSYLINSVHCYFLRPGRKGSVCYHVNRVKDGQSFCFRNVVGIQEDKPIITCMVSFKSSNNEDKDQSNELTHNKYPLDKQQISETIPPYSETSNNEYFLVQDKPQIRLKLYHLKTPFLLLKESTEPKQMLWMKPSDPLSNSAAAQNEHRLAVIYSSDYHLNLLVLYKYPEYSTKVFSTSLDHSIYFHSNRIDFNDWHFANLECVNSGNELTLNTSRIYNRHGDLIASATQQGYTRINAAKL